MLLVRTRSSCRISPSAPRTHTELCLSPRSTPITKPASLSQFPLLLFFMPVSSSAPHRVRLVENLPFPLETGLLIPSLLWRDARYWGKGCLRVTWDLRGKQFQKAQVGVLILGRVQGIAFDGGCHGSGQIIGFLFSAATGQEGKQFTR